MRDRQRDSAFCSTRRTVSPSPVCVPQQRHELAVTIGARPSEGSSRRSSRGREISARPIDQHLVLAARERRRRRRWRRPAAREQLVDLLDGPAFARAQAPERAEPEVLLDGQLLDDAASFGDVGDAAADDVLDRGAQEVDRRRSGPTRPGSHQPGDGAQQRRLAGAVRAEHGRDRPVGRRRTRRERLDRPVGDVRPSTASTTVPGPAAGLVVALPHRDTPWSPRGPSPRPACRRDHLAEVRTTIRSHTDMTRSMWCSTRRTPSDRLRPRISAPSTSISPPTVRSPARRAAGASGRR